MSIGINAKAENMMIYKGIMYDKKSTLDIDDLFKIFMEEHNSYNDFSRALMEINDITPTEFFINNVGHEYNIINSFSWERANDEGFGHIDFDMLNDVWNDLLLYGDTIEGNVVYQIKKNGIPSNEILSRIDCTIGGIA